MKKVNSAKAAFKSAYHDLRHEIHNSPEYVYESINNYEVHVILLAKEWSEGYRLGRWGGRIDYSKWEKAACRVYLSLREDRLGLLPTYRGKGSR